MSTPLPTPPRKPEPHECCGTGCIPCVMDIYEEELYEYERALKRLADGKGGAIENVIPQATSVAQLVIPTHDPV